MTGKAFIRLEEKDIMIELLAPAKDKNCAIAAINYGADAIYIGASDFGARRNVPNSLEDITEIVQYAHKFGVKVYVTINTILNDDEIVKAKTLIEKLYEIGVDAIIVQDMGFFELDLPPIPLHMSTQCDNRTVEKVKFLEKMGASRVILARELSIEQIKEIKDQTNVELETFIHGALCVSYSGQCYLSQMIGGRSANRGECAQPCRKKYSLVDEKGYSIARYKHLLNLKDFNASAHLKRLAEIGVTSFKIEGRLKDENYVKNVVGFYRKKIDEINKELGIKKASSGKVIFDFEPKLEKSFNRGFTDYFLEKRGACFSQLSPKSMGEYLGKVKKISGNFFEIEMPVSASVSHLESSHAATAGSCGVCEKNSYVANERCRPSKDTQSCESFQASHTAAAAQDGLCFYVENELSGCLVNKVEEIKDRSRSGSAPRVQRVFPTKMDGIKAGVEIYRNVDFEFEKALKNSKTARKISADITFELGSVKVADEDKNSAEIQYNFEELAQNETKMIENIKNQLKKSGDSDFLIDAVYMDTEKIPFLPVSKLNELRRELLEKLTQVRIKNYKRIERNLSGEPASYPLSEIDYSGNVLNKFAKKFYEKHGCTVSEMALESGVAKAGKRAMTTKHCLKYAFNMCNKDDAANADRKLFLIDEKGKRYPLKFNCKNCEMEIYFGEE